MRTGLRLLVTLAACSLLVASFAPHVIAAVARVPAPPGGQPLAADLTQLSTAGLTALSGCARVLPPNEGVPACCMFGYVFLDGEPVAGARVTITSGANGASTTTFTEDSPNSAQPSFRANLSRAPLSAQPGDVLTIRVAYGGHDQTFSHVVIGGSQQVDLVLARKEQLNNYVADWQVARQPEPGTFNRPTGMAFDRSGGAYVVDTMNNRVQVFDSRGVFVRQWGSQGDLPGQFAAPVGIAVDSRGRVYVADQNNSRVQIFTNTGTWLGEITGGGGSSFTRPIGLALDADENLYVTDWWNHRVSKFDKSGAFVRAWGSLGQLGIDPGNLEGRFNQPYGIAVDGAVVYVVDRLNHRVQYFSADGDFLGMWGTLGSQEGQLNTPYGIGVDSAHRVFVADQQNQRVQQFDGAGVFERLWGGSGAPGGAFNTPTGLAVDPDDNVFVAEQENHRIQRFDSAGRHLSTWGRRGVAFGQFDQPQGLSLDGQGNLYVADWNNHRIQKFAPDGSFLASFGSQGSLPGQLFQPTGVAVDAAGTIYVADAGNHRIQKLAADGTPLDQWGSFGAGDGQLSYPYGVALNDAGTLVYVSDQNNSRIQRFSSDGAHQLTWGSAGAGDGELNLPRGMAVDSAGNLYVADWNNRRVQKFDQDGGFLDAIALPGAFRIPSGVALDDDDNLYVANYGDHNLLKFAPDGDLLATVGAFGVGIGALFWTGGVAVSGDGSLLYASEIANNRIQRFRLATFTRPIATIVAASPRQVTQDDGVELLGRGGDSVLPDAIAAYEWSVDGTPFATGAGATLATDGLAPGAHTVTLRVRDGRGVFSEPQSLVINVLAAGAPETWTMLLYLDADTGDDDIAPALGRDLGGALYRLERLTLPANVRVFALYDGPESGDSVTLELQPGAPAKLTPAGEVNMGDPQTLSGFVAGLPAALRSDRYYLAIADHANGLDGTAWDYTTGRQERLENGELRDALLTIAGLLGQPVDVLHLDSCLMGLVEVAYQVRGSASYVVVSQNLAWSAFAYDAYIQSIGARTSARELALAVVDSYAQRVAGYPFTIAALDLTPGPGAGGAQQPGKLEQLVAAVDGLALALIDYAYASEANRAALSALREQAQKFDSLNLGRLTNDQEFVDLDHWAALVAGGVADGLVQSSAQAVQSAVAAFVIGERHASGLTERFRPDTLVDLERARGVAIYFPPRANVRTYQLYAQGPLTFTADTNWDEFLGAQYGAAFTAANPDPIPAPHRLLEAPAQAGSAVYLPSISR